MNKIIDNFQQETTKKPLSAFDFVIDSIVYLISWIVAIFLPVSFGSSQGAAGVFAKNKYEIVKIVSLILLSSLILVLVLVNSFNSNVSSSGVDLGMEATDISGIKAVVLNVPYFNQLAEPDGTQAPFTKVGGGLPLGGVMCGAASSTMIAGFFGKIPFDKENEHDLKRFAHRDEGMNLPTKCGRYGVGGAFGMTAYDNRCNQSGVAGMQEYFSRIGLKSSVAFGSPSFETVKNSIDSKRPMIVSLLTFEGYGHLAVIKGYTEDGKFVMNDPWTDVQAGGKRKYSYKGKNALYLPDLGDQGSFVYYLIVG